MKKLLVFLCAIALVFSVAGSANALLHTETINLGVFFGGDTSYNGGMLGGEEGGYFWQGYNPVTYSWSFTTPSDFIVPPSEVYSASVSIFIGWIDTDYNDLFTVENVTVNLGEGGLVGSPGDNIIAYELDIASLFISWPSEGTVDCSLLIDENEIGAGLPDWGGDLFLGDSTFNLDYSPVPEPATMLLLGSGLIGLAGLGRKKFFKRG